MMVNQELLDYIKKQQEAGTPKDQIVAALKSAGWDDTSVTEAYFTAGSDNPVSPQVQEEKTPPEKEVVQTAPIKEQSQKPSTAETEPFQTPAEPIQPTQPDQPFQATEIVTDPPLEDAPANSTATTKSTSKSSLKPIIFGALGLFVLLGVVFAASQIKFTREKLELLSKILLIMGKEEVVDPEPQSVFQRGSTPTRTTHEEDVAELEDAVMIPRDAPTGTQKELVDNLRTCTPFKTSYFFDEKEVQQEIVGIVDGECKFIQGHPMGDFMECTISEDLLDSAADTLLITIPDNFGSEEASQTSTTLELENAYGEDFASWSCVYVYSE